MGLETALAALAPAGLADGAVLVWGGVAVAVLLTAAVAARRRRRLAAAPLLDLGDPVLERAAAERPKFAPASCYRAPRHVGVGSPVQGDQIVRGSAAHAVSVPDRMHMTRAGASSPMDAIAASVFATDKRPVVLFDGVCNLCNKGVNIMLDLDDSPTGRVRFAALQSQVGQSLLQFSGREAGDISSIVLVEESRAWFKSDAVLRIAQLLNVPLSSLGALGLLVPGFLRDGAYDTVAQNRYRIFGESDECRLTDVDYSDRFIPEPADTPAAARKFVPLPPAQAFRAKPARAPCAPVAAAANVVVEPYPNEAPEELLKRFKREVNKSGHMRVLRNRNYFENNQEKRIRKVKEGFMKRKNSIRGQREVQRRVQELGLEDTRRDKVMPRSSAQ